MLVGGGRIDSNVMIHLHFTEPMKTYKAAEVTLTLPDTLFDMLDRETSEHVIKSYLEEDNIFLDFSSDEKLACINEFLDQIKPRGSCWGIV